MIILYVILGISIHWGSNFKGMYYHNTQEHCKIVNNVILIIILNQHIKGTVFKSQRDRSWRKIIKIHSNFGFT